MTKVKARLRGGLADEYFKWMIGLIHGPKLAKKTYRKLLRKLHETPFKYVMERDINRAEDGMDLRYRFGYENQLSRDLIRTELDISEDCSVLEMMIALAHRCEESIISDEEEDRTKMLFTAMVNSLGLEEYDDLNWDPEAVDYILNRFMKRKYERNGRGGLFTIHNQPRMDQRKVEIWYQMMAWLIEQDERGNL